MRNYMYICICFSSISFVIYILVRRPKYMVYIVQYISTKVNILLRYMNLLLLKHSTYVAYMLSVDTLDGLEKP